MSTLIAIITLLSGIVSLIAWWVKRKRAPTQEERIDDANRENADSLEAIKKLRDNDEHDKAEEMLARMRQRAATGWVRNKSANPGLPTGSPGERMDPNDTRGIDNRGG